MEPSAEPNFPILLSKGYFTDAGKSEKGTTVFVTGKEALRLTRLQIGIIDAEQLLKAFWSADERLEKFVESIGGE